MSIEKEQFEKVMAELRRACLPAGGADVIQAYVNAQGGALEHLRTERRHDAQIQAAMAADQAAVAEALGIPPGEYSGGAGEQLLAIEKLREALARVEAERDTAIVQMQNIRTNRDRLNKQLGDAEFTLCIAQQQLTEAAGLLRKIDSEIWPEWDRHGSQAAALANVKAFLADYDQAGQQEECAHEFVPFQPACLKCGELYQVEQQEAQGAQAGDEQSAFLSWAEREYQTGPDEDLNLKHVDVIQNRKGWMARAALATQPAVPEVK